jgi:HK97 family phage prohead protease
MYLEKRFLNVGNPELRAAGGDGAAMPTIVGFVAVFDAWSPVYGGARWGWREKIAPTFFDDVIGEGHDPVSLFNHDCNYALGRPSAGNNTLEIKAEGLWSEVTPPDTPTIRDLVITPIQMGIIKGASFAFSLADEDGDEWNVGPDGVMERVLLKASELYDTSPAVTQPWYPQTTSDLKARAQRSLLKLESAGPAVISERERLQLHNQLLLLRG